MDDAIARRARRTDAQGREVARDPDAACLLRSDCGALQEVRAYGYKSLNENLAPLRRYLVRQVDRPWNKVWSEY